jgi:hypothetical protein
MDAALPNACIQVRYPSYPDVASGSAAIKIANKDRQEKQ